MSCQCFGHCIPGNQTFLMKVNTLVKVEFKVGWNPQVFFLIKLLQSQSSPASCIFNYFWNLSLPCHIYAYKNLIHCSSLLNPFWTLIHLDYQIFSLLCAGCRFGLFHVVDGNLDCDLTKGRARGLFIQAALSWPQFIQSTLMAAVQQSVCVLLCFPPLFLHLVFWDVPWYIRLVSVRERLESILKSDVTDCWWADVLDMTIFHILTGTELIAPSWVLLWFPSVSDSTFQNQCHFLLSPNSIHLYFLELFLFCMPSQKIVVCFCDKICEFF